MKRRWSPGGEVVSVSTSGERVAEMEKWIGHPWWNTLAWLNFDLSYIDPDYTLIQCKEKFHRLAFYFSSSKPHLIREMRERVAKAEREIERIERSRRHFDASAIAPRRPPKSDW